MRLGSDDFFKRSSCSGKLRCGSDVEHVAVSDICKDSMNAVHGNFLPQDRVPAVNPQVEICWNFDWMEI